MGFLKEEEAQEFIFGTGLIQKSEVEEDDNVFNKKSRKYFQKLLKNRSGAVLEGIIQKMKMMIFEDKEVNLLTIIKELESIEAG